ncbi:MAG TPA: SDR family NAD(P)-dependent oxidoreductase [Thermomicrobiales bacterium]|nr:SDR family NAD(P)-dependent oxidoreductase [Thermomicrobiales bacterium]
MTTETDPQIVVVTGASSGVGRAIAHAFGQRGAHVVPIAPATRRLCRQPLRRSVRPEAMPSCCPWTWRTALRRMRPRSQETIIQIGSALAYRSIPLQSAYCAAKAAIRGFTDSLRTELIHEGSNIRVTMLQLPAVNTPQSLRQRNKLPQLAQPVPPLFAPEAIAGVVVWAADHAPREMLIGRPSLQTVWAQKFFPSLLDLYLGKTGYTPQMVDDANNQNGRDILFETLSEDPGARGPYNDKEQGPDLQMRLRPHARPLSAAFSIASSAFKAIGRRA